MTGQSLCDEGVSTLPKQRKMSPLLLLGVPALSAVAETGHERGLFNKDSIGSSNVRSHGFYSGTSGFLL